jgi:hypothetical protein
MHNIDEFTRQFVRFTERDDFSKLVVVIVFGLMTVIGIVLGLFRARAVRRLQAAADAYAEREMAEYRRLLEPSSVRLVPRHDRRCCRVSSIDPNLRVHLVE